MISHPTREEPYLALQQAVDLLPKTDEFDDGDLFCALEVS